MTMVLAVMYREFRIRTTTMIWAFYDLFVPLAYLFLFGLAFNATISSGIMVNGEPVSYNAFFLPGLLAMSSFGIAINTSYGFFVDRDNGIFYEFLTYPMTRAQLLLGKILFSCVMALLQAFITVAIGSLALDVPVLWERSGLLAVATIAGTAGWFFFLAIFALRIRRNDLFNTLINGIYFVFMFASSIFYPLDTMPGWLRTIALANPLTWHTDVLRYALTGGDRTVVLLQAACFLLFLLASFFAAVQTLRRKVLE